MAIPPLWCATGQPATPSRTDRGRPDVGTRNCKLPHPKKLQPKLEPRCLRPRPFSFHTHCTRVQLANVRAGVARPLYWWQSNCQEITMSAQKPSEANGTTKPEPKHPKPKPNNKHTNPTRTSNRGTARNQQTKQQKKTQHNQQTKEHGRRTSNNSARTTTTKDEEQHARNQQTKPKTRPRTKTHKECHISELATMAISTTTTSPRY